MFVKFSYGSVRIPIGKECNCNSHSHYYVCTLEAKHEGVHAAHGSDREYPIAIWDDELENLGNTPLPIGAADEHTTA